MILLLAAMQDSRAQNDEATIEDNGVAHTRVTWHVANNGVDSPNCGRRSSPCRTITQGIVNSTAGDLVLVGPGLYGDLNGDCAGGGTFPQEDEEFGSEFCRSPAGVCLNKAVTVASVAGPEATVIDGCGYTFVVEILASDSTFGLPHRGFTLLNGLGSGVQLEAPSNVTVSGNIARPDPAFRGGHGFVVALGRNHRLVGNLARDGAFGFRIFGLGVRVTDNIAVSNQSGFGGGHDNIGFQFANLETFVARNSAIANDIGFDVRGAGHVLSGNSAIGNQYYGIRLRDFFIGLGASPSVERSNIFGNNSVPLDGNVNCGIANETNLDVNATNNFWGAPTGPGPNRPRSPRSVGGGQIIVEPFATTEIPIRSSYTLSTSSLVLGNQPLNLASSAKTITLRNTGVTVLPIMSVAIGGTNPLQFAQTNNCGASVAVGAACAIKVTFKPTSTGSKLATLSVTAGGGAGTKTTVLLGTGVRSTFSVSTTALSFGKVARSATSTSKAVKISNTGGVVLPISSIVLAGTNPGQFARTTNCPARVAVGGSCTVSVVFKPTSTGAKSATLQVTPGGGAALKSVALSGTGI